MGKFVVAWIVIFVVWFAGSYIVHGVLLHEDYSKLSNLFRTEADEQNFFPLMILAHVMLSGALVWIYTRGAEAKPWLGQGIRFGSRSCSSPSCPAISSTMWSSRCRERP
jgi:hypothetical protein